MTHEYYEENYMNTKKDNNKILENEGLILVVLVVVNMIGFLAWAFFYSVYHDYIRHFMFDILGLPFYPRVLTMFIIYFGIAMPVSIAIYYALTIFQVKRKN